MKKNILEVHVESEKQVRQLLVLRFFYGYRIVEGPVKIYGVSGEYFGHAYGAYFLKSTFWGHDIVELGEDLT